MLQKYFARFINKRIRMLKRLARDKSFYIAAVVLVLCVGIIVYTSYMQHKRLTANPATFASLMTVIGQAESSGRYNAYFNDTGKPAINFTNMTITQVIAWQHTYVAQGSASSAVGKYQILDTTLSGLVSRLHLATSQKFSAQLQDRLAESLIVRRGANDYVNHDLSATELATNLAMEWAGLPKITEPNPDQSYYASDGLNRARADVDSVINAVKKIKAE